MLEKEEILKENIKEYVDFGERALKERKYNSATTLFFKAISAEVDLFILKKEGFVRLRVDGEVYPVTETFDLDENKEAKKNIN